VVRVKVRVRVGAGVRVRVRGSRNGVMALVRVRIRVRISVRVRFVKKQRVFWLGFGMVRGYALRARTAAKQVIWRRKSKKTARAA
jgi:hypothetical protein